MSAYSSSRNPVSNHLLAALPPQEYERLLPNLERRSPNQKGSNGGTVEVLLSERSHAPSILESSCGVVGNRAEGCQPD